MPILMMALLALIIFGLIGILLTTAMILEHRKHTHAIHGEAAPAVTSGTAPPLNRSTHSPRGNHMVTARNPSAKETSDEHGCPG